MSHFIPTYAISAIAPISVNEKIQAVRKHFKIFPQLERTRKDTYIIEKIAHVTLKMPFYLNTEIIQATLLKKLSSISIPKINMETTSVRLIYRKTYGNIIILNVKENTELRKLHIEICDLIEPMSTNKEEGFDRDNFYPHLTVMYSVPDSKVKKAKDYVKNAIPTLKFPLNSFWLTKNINENREKELIKIYSLG